MSVWSDSAPAATCLRGAEGELISIRISVEPRLLEGLLDVLAGLDFPINPHIHHAAGAPAVVEFPAWAARLDQVRNALRHAGFESAGLTAQSMLEEIAPQSRTAAGRA